MHSVAIERDEHTVIVRAAGELDAFAVPDLSAVFAELRDAKWVLADLDRVSFMDSTVLSLIVRLARDLAEAGAKLRIVLPSGSARRIFEITSLDQALPIAATRLAALEELAA
jgi:anti-anti-sigma factor